VDTEALSGTESTADLAMDAPGETILSPTDMREKFIPIRRADLTRLLADRLPPIGSNRQHFGQLCELLSATFHHEYHSRLEDLKNLYAPFDPDADTSPAAPLPDAERDDLAARLFGKLTALLERANYQRVPHDHIYAALDSVSVGGVNLHVDLESFELLEVYARGEGIEHRTHRSLRTLYRAREVEVPILHRLVVAFRPRQGTKLADGVCSSRVYVKMFKSIPKTDLEMLLPGTQVKMTVTDRGKILLPAVSGITIALYKILTGALALAVAGVAGLLTFLGLVGGTVGYGVKSLLSYQRAKDKYQLHLARSLYFQNLDNNAGVFYRLLDEAEEQEFREAVLAYFLLWQHSERRGLTMHELDAAAEQLIRDAVGIEVDFEVDDALAKLTRLRLVQTLPAGELRAVPIEDAVCLLDLAWDQIFQYAPAPVARPAGGDEARHDDAEERFPPAHRPWSSSPWG